MAFPVSILYKSIAGRYRPVRVADGPITARYIFIKNAYWVVAARCGVLFTFCPVRWLSSCCVGWILSGIVNGEEGDWVYLDWLQSPVTKYFFLIICLIIH